MSTEAYKLSWYLNTVLILGLILGCVMSLCSGPWIEKVNLLYSMEVNLFQVTMKPGVISMGLQATLSSGVRQKLSQWDHERKYDFDEFHSWVCQVPPSVWGPAPCTLWDNLKVANYVLLICGSFGLAVMMCGWAMEWQYCLKPRKKTKEIVRVLYTVAPALLILACSVYYWCGRELKDMLPRTEVEVLCRGFYICFMCATMSPAPLLIQYHFAPTSEDELGNEISSAERKNVREATRQKAWEEREFGPGGYGANQGAYGSCAPPMAMGGVMVQQGMQPMQPGMLPTQHGQAAW